MEQLRIQRVLWGNVQLLYISPENLLNNAQYRSMLLSQRYKKDECIGCRRGTLC